MVIAEKIMGDRIAGKHYVVQIEVAPFEEITDVIKCNLLIVWQARFLITGHQATKQAAISIADIFN